MNIRSIYICFLMTVCTVVVKADVNQYIDIPTKQTTATPVNNAIQALFTGQTQLESPENVLFACSDDAGTIAATINGTALGPTTTNFANWNATISIAHNGGSAAQDGDATSPPGFDIAIYENGPPTPAATGPTAADINADINYTGDVVNTDITGAVTYQNTGGYQNFYNGGDPIMLWFAPITLDDHANKDLTENVGNVNECVNVNTAGSIDIVFLNQIDTSGFINPINPNGDKCQAQIKISGGFPQWDGSDFTITVVKTTNPAIVATIISPPSTHNSLLQFTVPEPGDYEIQVTDNNGGARNFTVAMNSCVLCNDNAGTATPALGFTAASNNSSFLCFGDSMLVTHNGNAVLTGDPNTTTPSGLGYVMYTCAPTVAGNTVALIASDPCIINQTGSSAGFDIVNGTDIMGNVNIFNNGSTYQNLLGGIGSTGEIWFAPITIDNHANGSFEATGTPNECTNVNIGSPFSITFLNEIQITPIGTSICNGSFSVVGGLPQNDNSAYNITIELTTNSLITGTVTNVPVTHNGTAQFTVPQPGIYRITVTDNIACGSPNNSNTYLVDMSTCPFPCTGVVDATLNLTTSISCNGGSNGELTVAVNGGTPPLTFDWAHDNTLTTNVASSLSTGSYTVTVTDANGCDDVETLLVGQPDPIVADLDSTGILCNGDMTSSIWVKSITGGTGAYTYVWSAGTPGVTSDTTTNVGAGTYTLIVTDANGCSENFMMTLTEPTALATSIVDLANTDCDASATGTGTVVPIGGTTTFNDYNYTWSHDATLNDSVAINLPSGTFYVTVSDANGCQTVDSVIITEIKTIVTNVDSLDVDCYENASGMAWVTTTTTGGAANLPYSYMWSHDNTIDNDTVFNLIAGTYYVTVTDAANCFKIDSVVVNQPDTLITVVQSMTNVNCAGDMTGTATVSVVGGTMPYSFSWTNNAATTATLSNAGVGTYTVTGIDDNGCQSTADVTIGQNSVITITQVDTTKLACAGDMNGGFVVTYSGGTLPYSYSWSTNPAVDTNNAVTGLGAGVYYLTMTDGLGCVRTDTFNLAEPAGMSGITSAKDLNCATDQNGEAYITVSGGTMPYSYIWSSNTVDNDTITGLIAGKYFVTVTDDNGCTYTDSATVTAPPIIDISVTTTEVSCLGGANGTATASVTGGTGGYTYLWDSLQTGQTATQLSAGQHILIVTDLSGCQISDTFNVNQTAQILPSSISSVPVSCFGGNDGSATIEVTGGTEPYTYFWTTTPAQDSSTAIGLTQGTYQVFVSDANGCVLAPINITVNEPPALVIDSIVGADPLCNNSDDGSVTVYPSGGTPSYDYQWSGSNEITNTNNNLFAGAYSVTVTDAKGCQTTSQTNLADPLMLVGFISTSSTTCNGGKDGRIEIDTVVGGAAPYTYSIDGINFLSTDIVFFGLFGGNYDVTIKDAKGCTFVQTVLIDEPPLITVDLGPDIELDLGDSTQLSAFVNTTDSLVFFWQAADSSTISCLDCPYPWVRPIESSDYLVTVVDTNGCEATDDIFIKIDKNRRAFIPTAFTPNGDGINDRLIIYGGTGVEEIISFKIFNRWGELMHSADNFTPGSYQHGWDGSFRGKLLDPAVFVYFIEVRFSDGVVFPYKGDITLLR